MFHAYMNINFYPRREYKITYLHSLSPIPYKVVQFYVLYLHCIVKSDVDVAK